jgi:hypothetical protein
MPENTDQNENPLAGRDYLTVRDPVKRRIFIAGAWEDLRAPDSTPFSRGLARERLRWLGVDPDAEEGDAGDGQGG